MQSLELTKNNLKRVRIFSVPSWKSKAGTLEDHEKNNKSRNSETKSLVHVLANFELPYKELFVAG